MIKVRKLRLPLWQEIVYFILVAGAPAIITSIELFQSHSALLKISFISIGALLLTLLIVKKFVINNKIDKLKDKITMLEHDYSIEVGNENSCRSQWALFNILIFAYNMLCVLFILVLFIILINAIINNLISFRGASLLILLFAFIGMIWKIICYFIYAKEIE